MRLKVVSHRIVYVFVKKILIRCVWITCLLERRIQFGRCSLMFVNAVALYIEVKNINPSAVYSSALHELQE